MSTDAKMTKAEEQALTTLPSYLAETWPYVTAGSPADSEPNVIMTVAVAMFHFLKPTKKGKKPTPTDCMKFCWLCQQTRLNPWTNDCYALPYDNEDGTAIWAFHAGYLGLMKRAEEQPEYDGLEYGVIVRSNADPNAPTELREGEMVEPDREKLLGGWCRIYRTDRTRPTLKTVNLSAYSKGNSMWRGNPAGMIGKVAIAGALRLTFPVAFAGVYLDGEMPDQAEEQAAVQKATGTKTGLPAPDINSLGQQLKDELEAARKAADVREPVAAQKPAQAAKATPKPAQPPTREPGDEDDRWVTEDPIPEGELFDRGNPIAE